MHLAFTWNLEYAKPSGSECRRRSKGGLRRTTWFSKHLPFEPWNLNWTFQQKSLGISPVWCNIVCLYLPLSSLWENGNVKCPASAASGKTRCLHINSEILVLNLPWSIIVKEPLRILRSNCKLQLFPPVCLFSPLDATKAPFARFLSCTGNCAFSESRQAFTPVLLGNAIFFFLTIRF